MADGRFVSKSIAQSEQLGRVSLEADYLFGRCIPHLDREGRMTGNPELVRSMVCPLRPEMTANRVEAALVELADEELVVWYDVEGRQCLFFAGFERHQRGIRKDREAASRFPAHTAEGVLFLNNESRSTPEDSGPPPPKGSELNSKGSRSEVKVSAAPNWVAQFCEAWDRRFAGTVPGGRIGRALKPLRKKYPDVEILARWERYLAQPDGKFLKPEIFASTFADWDGVTADPLAPRPGESGAEMVDRIIGVRTIIDG